MEPVFVASYKAMVTSMEFYRPNIMTRAKETIGMCLIFTMPSRYCTKIFMSLNSQRSYHPGMPHKVEDTTWLWTLKPVKMNDRTSQENELPGCSHYSWQRFGFNVAHKTLDVVATVGSTLHFFNILVLSKVHSWSLEDTTLLWTHKYFWCFLSPLAFIVLEYLLNVSNLCVHYFLRCFFSYDVR